MAFADKEADIGIGGYDSFGPSGSGFGAPGEGPSSPGLIGGSGYQQMDEGAEEALASASMGGGPQQDTDASMGGGPSTGTVGQSDSEMAFAEVPGNLNPGRHRGYVIEVDTFEDIQKAQEEAATRALIGSSFDSVTGNPAISTGLQVDNFSNINAAVARTLGNVETGSVNLAPIGINVGYQSNIGKIDSFDQLDESTKAAVKAAGIQSQSEDETENAISQIFSAFQKILGQASKNTTNRQQGSMGPDQ